VATFQSNYPWAPNQAAVGVDVHNVASVFTGQIQKQGGQRSFPPAVTAPGTIASAGTVQNSTGYDCLVYASATSGIGSVKVLSYNGGNATSSTPYGTVSSAATAAVLVPGPGAIAVTYNGTLTWTWQPL
jgi:hypothetical protein